MSFRDLLQTELTGRGVREVGRVTDSLLSAFEDTVQEILKAEAIEDASRDFPDLVLTHGPCPDDACADPACLLFVNGVKVCVAGRTFIETAQEKGLALKWPVLWCKVEELSASLFGRGLREQFLFAAGQILLTHDKVFQDRAFALFPTLQDELKRQQRDLVEASLRELVASIAASLHEQRTPDSQA